MTLARTLLPILLLPLLLGACQTTQPTAYGPVTAKSPYGYKDQQLDASTWRVTVAGNAKTDRDLVENQLLYRAAEIALAAGADGFVVLDRDVDRDVQYRTVVNDPFYAYPYGGFWGVRPYYDPITRHLYPPGVGPYGYGFGGYSAGVGRVFGPPTQATTQSISKYTAYAEVRLYQGSAPDGEGTAFDAREVIDQLGSQVNKASPGKS